MRCRVLVISDSDKHFSSACAEYEKRLGKSLEIEAVSPVRHGTPAQIIQKETEMLITMLQKEKNKGSICILLSKAWKQLSTEQFASYLATHHHVTFVIGGPYGLDEEKMLPSIDLCVSFGAHTMPHGLAKLVLLEQIYRVDMMQQGRSYHY